MSQTVVSQRVSKTCEGCGSITEYEMVNPSDDVVRKMTDWFTIIREVVDPESGRFVKIMVQACSLPCVGAASLKLVIPDANTDGIDMNSLRASNFTPEAN